MNQFKHVLEKCKSCNTYELLEEQLDLIFQTLNGDDFLYHSLERDTWKYIRISGREEEVCNNVEWNVFVGKNQIGYTPVFKSETDFLCGLLYYLQYKKI